MCYNISKGMICVMRNKYKIILLVCITLLICCTLPVSAMESVIDNAGVTTVWDNGYRGEGMVVAILDLEFDVNHELFTLSESTMPKLTEADVTAIIDIGLSCSDKLESLEKSPYINSKIPFAYDYVANTTNVNGSGLIHGTHIAGIIGANRIGAADNTSNAFDGIAPEAQLLLMKISDNDGNINYAATIAALSDAISLGADVINISWGQAAGFTDNVTAFDYYNLIRRALNQGIDVVASAGNSPRIGTMSEYDNLYGINDPLAADPDYGLVAAPSLLSQVISVASYNNDTIVVKGHIETYNGEKIIYTETYNTFADLLMKSNDIFEYVIIESDGNQRLYETDTINYKNKLVVIEYISDTKMMSYLKDKGAVGVIFYSQYENNPFMRAIESEYIPVAFISNEAGKQLIESEKYELTLYEYPSVVRIDNPAGDTISHYSGWGTSASLELKPDITAIGGNVYSTSPNNQYETMSGTSMSSPVIAGGVTLLKQYINQLGIEANNQYTARQLMMSTAEPAINPDTGIEYSPRQQGAGLLKLDRAIKSDILLYNVNTVSTKIELSDNLGDQFEIEFTVRNLTKDSLEYNINASIFTDAYYYNETSKKYFAANYSIAMSHAQIFMESDIITIPANSTVTITLRVVLDSGEVHSLLSVFTNGFYIEGYIYLTPAYDSGVQVSIPYMGFYGDWNDPPIFDDGFYMQSLGSNYLAGFGTVEFELGTNIFANDTVNRNLYVFSPNGDSYADSLIFISKSLRNYYLLGFYIADSDGEVIYEGMKDEYSTKAYAINDEIYSIYDYIWDGSDKLNEKYIYPDGIYYLSIVTAIDIHTAPQIYTIAFNIDTQKPVINDVKAISDTEFEITVEDLFAVQMVRAYYIADGENVLLDKIYAFSSDKPKREVILTIDITSDNSSGFFYIEAVDYALNTTTYKVNLSDYNINQ